MLGREGEIFAVATQVEVGVAPGVELGGAPQGLASRDATGAFLGVMHDNDGDGVPSLQLT